MPPLHRSSLAACPPNDRIAALSAGTLEAPLRPPLMEHVADCERCRHKLIEVRGIELVPSSTAETSEAVAVPPEVLERAKALVPSARLGGASRLMALAAVFTLVAGLSFILVGPPTTTTNSAVSPDSPLRASPSMGGPESLTAELLPLSDGDAIRFSWQPIAGTNGHALVVLNAEGQRVLEFDALDPPVDVPAADIPVSATAWWVVATFDDGSTRASQPAVLNVARATTK